MVAAVALFSTPTLACGGKGKYELSLKKMEGESDECIPLLLEYPEVVGGLGQVKLGQEYDDGKDHFLSVDLVEFDKKDGIITTYFCVSEEVLKHTSIAIEWYHHVIREDGSQELGMCSAGVDTGNLYELLKAGGTKAFDPSVL